MGRFCHPLKRPLNSLTKVMVSIQQTLFGVENLGSLQVALESLGGGKRANTVTS